MILVGDCLDLMRTLEPNSMDSIVTDPPYGLGFMGKAWDHGVPGVPFWVEALRVAKPGAWLAAFGGTRTYHRLACAIEDAGWELRDTLMWLYGSGFPKSKNPCTCKPPVRTEAIDAHGWRLCGSCGKQYELGTALKPAWEPIVLARKPLIGTVDANVLVHGTGGLNIDGCRVETDDGYATNRVTQGGDHFSIGSDEKTRGTTFEPNAAGRWPANVVHDGSEEVLACFPDAPGQVAKASTSTSTRKNQNTYGSLARGSGGNEPRDDAGSAARFFYCAKASREDRNDGCDELPTVVTDVLAGHRSRRMEEVKRPDGAPPATGKNNHPTVKPTELMRWLCRLVTPRGGLVLDPFTGSGSTGRGAIAEGMRFVGIELDPEYAAIAEARIRAVQPGLSLGAA